MSHTWLIKRKVENLIQNDLHTKSHTAPSKFSLRGTCIRYTVVQYILINTI